MAHLCQSSDQASSDFFLFQRATVRGDTFDSNFMRALVPTPRHLLLLVVVVTSFAEANEILEAASRQCLQQQLDCSNRRMSSKSCSHLAEW